MTKKILYDATILRFGLNPSCARSGIFVVASELLAEMCRREGPKPDVYVDPQALFEVRGYFASRSDFRKLKIVNDVNRGILGGLRVWLLMKQVPPAGQRGGAVKKVAWLFYRIFREVSLVLLDLVFSGAEKKVQKRMANDYDAFFSPMYKAPDVVRESSMKRFTVIYDTIPQVFPEIYGNNPGVYWTQELIDSLSGRDWCFSISEATKRDFLRFSPRLDAKRVSVIPLAASQRFAPCEDADRMSAVRKKYGIPRKCRYLLSLCTLEPRKNLPFTIKAFAKFARQHEDVVLVLAGSHWAGYAEEMEKALRAVSGMRSRVIMPGYIADEDQAALYSGAMAFVYMSIYEGFGLPPLEAMQCGTPIITSNVSSLPEVAGMAGIQVSPDDLDGLVRAMSHVAEKGALRKELRTKGLERCKRFSWKNAVDIINADIVRECEEASASRPKRLLFDATILRYGLNDNSGRSGIYVASYELLRAMQDRPDMLVDLWIPAPFVPELQRYLALHPELGKVELSDISCGSNSYEATASRLESYVAPQLGDRAEAVARLIWFVYLAVRWPLIRIARFMHKRELRDSVAMIRGRYDGFFSPVFTAPEEIVRCGLPRYTVLYDTIPMLYPQFYAHATEEMWTSVLARKLTAEDKCFAISECTKRDFLKFSPNLKAENVSVIPLAAAERFYPCTDKAKIENVLKKYKLPTDRRYFLSLCTIEPRKNLAMALKAFAQFAKTDKDMIFILAGGGWDAYSAKWKDVLRSVSAVRKRIYMPGYIADEDLSPLYSGALAFVYMSIYEGFGLPPLEAMQCGVPVLSSNLSSLPEVVGDAALTVAPDDLDGAVDAMTRLASDDELCASLRQKGIARAKLFSWERAAEIIRLAIV